jgi:cytochrome d ubiquinol oxidase subunit I
LQILAGDFHGLNTLEHQPAKIAAVEGHWETRRGAPLILFGIPDAEEERTKFEIAIPKLGSLILTHDLNGEVRGLKSWPKDERPNSLIIFWSFRVMVGIGMLMALTGLLSLVLRIKGRLYSTAWFHRLAMLMGPAGFIAVIAGWVTTEVGRQPYLVYGLMRISEGRSPIAAPAVAGSLLSFVIVYCVVFGAGIFYVLRLMRKAPSPADPGIDPTQPHRASRAPGHAAAEAP